ncbi:hypothetical protein MC885_021304 [Smutsia gigantea]|nr:hypothetical protein MC885_021304 [Smutsia gigantea]
MGNVSRALRRQGESLVMAVWRRTAAPPGPGMTGGAQGPEPTPLLQLRACPQLRPGEHSGGLGARIPALQTLHLTTGGHSTMARRSCCDEEVFAVPPAPSQVELDDAPLPNRPASAGDVPIVPAPLLWLPCCVAAVPTPVSSNGTVDAASYQDVVDLTEDRKPQNPIQDNMENYRKLLSLGLKTMPEAKKSTHRRGICEDESSHGVIMEKFIKDVSCNSKSGRARESNDRPQRFPRRPDSDWREVPFNKRESVIQERGYEGNAFGGGFNFNSNLVSRKRVFERKRRYHFDTDGNGSVHDQRGCAKRKPFECNEGASLDGAQQEEPQAEPDDEDDLDEDEGEDAIYGLLRIQGSNVEAAEPEVEAAEPEVEAAEPEVEAAEPNVEAAEPNGEAEGPDGEAAEPNGEAEQPNGDADEPDGAGIEDPEERVEEPEGDADEPDGAGIEDPEEEGEDQEIQVEEPYYDCRECGETFTSHSAYSEHLKTHARVIIFESGNIYGESSHYTGHASTSTGDNDRAHDKYFRCDVCGQLFSDRLSLARHQNTHTG